MFVRLADNPDCEAIVDMARDNVNETLHEAFDPDCVRRTFQAYMDSAETTFFVVEDKGQVIGFLQACSFTYDYRAGRGAVQRVLYVVPEKRGTRAATLLMRELIEWAKIIGADRIEGGNDNSFRSEQTATFLGRFGFKQVGYAMRLKLDTN